MIYTSYFGNIRKIKAAFPDAVLVSIAGKTPDWFEGRKYGKLAPKYEWWREWKERFGADPDSMESMEWYVEKYNGTVLDKLDPRRTAEELEEGADGNPVFLLCYEAPGKFCHRHSVGLWLRRHGIECGEYSP